MYVADNAWRDYVRDDYHFHVQEIIVDADMDMYREKDGFHKAVRKMIRSASYTE